jgi:hypothetical protein
METLPEVLLEIKKALRVLPKVDVLSPFRVHFVNFGTYCLNLQVGVLPRISQLGLQIAVCFGPYRVCCKIRSHTRLWQSSYPYLHLRLHYGGLSVVQVSCYFATKSLDEYLYLQQLALMEITRVVNECGCRLAFPTTHVDVSMCMPFRQSRCICDCEVKLSPFSRLCLCTYSGVDCRVSRV